jgi:hypothetical protein
VTQEEYEALKRRFGPHPSRWPAPFRQEAEIFLATRRGDAVADEDAYLDRLVLEASLMASDERVLLKKVQHKIERRRAFPILDFAQWLPAGVAGGVAVLVGSLIAGYVTGGTRDTLDDLLLALAAGSPAASTLEALPELLAEELNLETFL